MPRWRQVASRCKLVAMSSESDPSGATPRPAGARRELVRLLLVDDHALVREGTAQLLAKSEGLEVVGQAGSARDALVLVDRLGPDVALVDVNLPDQSGLALAKEMVLRFPKVRVLILSAYDDYAYLAEAIQLKLGGYLLKTASASELVHAIRAVADGAFVLDSALSNRLAHRWRREQPGARGTLTPREAEVLALLARGRSNKDIAASLSLGLRTVETHVSSLLGKLGVASRTEAAHYALSHHMLSGDDEGPHLAS